MQETWNALDSAPDVVIGLMLLAASIATLIIGPIAFVAGLKWGTERRRRLKNDYIWLLQDYLHVKVSMNLLKREMDTVAERPVGDIHERMAGRN